MMLQDAGGVEGGQPKGTEVNTHCTAANRPENKTLLPGKRGGDTELVGLAPSWPATFTTGGMGTVQGGECSQMPPSHSALCPPPGVDLRVIF